MHRKEGFAADFALNVQMSPVPGNDMLDDGESQAGSPHGPGASLVGAIKSLRQPWNFICRNAVSLVDDCDGYPARHRFINIMPGRHFNFYWCVFVTITNCVGDEVLENLGQFIRIPQDRRQRSWNIQDKVLTPFPGATGKGGDNLVYNTVNPDRVFRSDMFLGFELGQREQVVDQARHTLRFGFHDFQKPFRGRLVVARWTAQCLDKSQQR